MGKHHDNYTAALLEDVNGKFDRLIEILQPFPQMQKDIAVIKDDVAELKTDMKVVNHAFKETSADLLNHTHPGVNMRPVVAR